MNVKLIRMWSGEDVITDLVEEKEDSIVLRNPIVAIPTSAGQMGFAPWSPLLNGRDTDVEITRRYIVYIAETQDEVVAQYELMYSTIQTPNKKLIV
jgi:hypothetical protein